MVEGAPRVVMVSVSASAVCALLFSVIVGCAEGASSASPFGLRATQVATTHEYRAHARHLKQRTRVERILSLNECEDIAAAAGPGLGLEGCGSSAWSLASEVPKQVYGADGIISQFKSLVMEVTSENGKRICGCAGISQVSTVPGRNESRLMYFTGRGPIHIYKVEYAESLPPNIRSVRLSACDRPADLSQVVTDDTNAYLAAMERMYAALVGAPGRRLRQRGLLSHVSPEGYISPDAPLHDAVAARLTVLASAVVVGARAAAFADSTNSSAVNLEAASRGARALDMFDPDSGFHAAHKGPQIPLEDFVRSMPYVSPDVWEASSSVVGSRHLGIRLAWSIAVMASHRIYVAESEAGDGPHLRGGAPPHGVPRVLRHKHDPAGRHLGDTIAATPELAVFMPAEGDSQRPLERGVHPLRRRELQGSLGGIAVASYLLVQLSRESKKVDALGEAADKCYEVLGKQQVQLGLLDQRVAQTNVIAQAQDAQLGLLSASVGDLNAWGKGLSSNISNTISATADLATKLASAEAGISNRYNDVVNSISESTALAAAATALQANISHAAIAALATTVTAGNQMIMQALADRSRDGDRLAASMLNHASITRAMYERAVQLFAVVMKQKDLHNTLFASIYSSVDFLEGSGWRPVWTAGAAAPGNRPDPPSWWWPGSPKRVMYVDTLLFLRTGRVPGSGGAFPATDPYAGLEAGAANLASSATHRAIEDSLTLWCDGAQLQGANVDVVTSAQAIFDLVGVLSDCVTPVAGNLTSFLSTYGTLGGATFNPSGKPLCTCWVQHVRRSCPTVLANATTPLVTMAPGGPRSITMAGLEGVTTGGVRRFTPCASGVGGASTLTTDTQRIIKTRAELQGVLADISCSDLGPGAWRNVTEGRAALGVAPNATTSDLADTYVFSARMSAPGQVSSGNNTFNGSVFAVGVGLPTNPRTNPGQNIAGTRDLCSGDPGDTVLYTLSTAASLAADVLVREWSQFTYGLGAVRAALFGIPHSDIVKTSDPYLYDTSKHSSYACMYAEYLAVQDGATQTGDGTWGPPAVPWPKVYVLTKEDTFGYVSVFMEGLPPTEEGANNALPEVRSMTTTILANEPMNSLVPARFVLVGDLERCMRAACALPAVGPYFNISRGTARYLYDVRENDLGLNRDPTLRRNKLDYFADRDTSTVNGTGSLVAESRSMTLDRWFTQNPDAGGLFQQTMGGATVAPFIRGLVSLTDGQAVSAADRVCDAPSEDGDGDACLRAQHYGVLVPALTGVDTDLAGTPAAVCGDPDRYCVTSRRVSMLASGLDVPGGTITQTLAAVCPLVEADMAGLGLGGVVVRGPASAPGSITWQYRWVCGTPDADADRVTLPGYASAVFDCTHRQSAAAAAAADANGTAFWFNGPGLDPGSSFTLSLDTPISNWVLQVRTRNPATGLSTPCRNATVYFQWADTLARMGPGSLVFQPVLSDDKVLAEVNSINQGLTEATNGLSDIITQNTMMQAVLLAATGMAENFAALQETIIQAAVDAQVAGVESVEEFTNRTLVLAARGANRSTELILQLQGIAQRFADNASGILEGSQELSVRLATNSNQTRVLQAIVDRASAELVVLTEEFAVAKNETLVALQELNATMVYALSLQGAEFDILSDLVDGTIAVVNEAASLVGKVFGVFGFMDWLLVIVKWVLYFIIAGVVVAVVLRTNKALEKCKLAFLLAASAVLAALVVTSIYLDVVYNVHV